MITTEDRLKLLQRFNAPRKNIKVLKTEAIDNIKKAKNFSEAVTAFEFVIGIVYQGDPVEHSLSFKRVAGVIGEIAKALNVPEGFLIHKISEKAVTKQALQEVKEILKERKEKEQQTIQFD